MASVRLDDVTIRRGSTTVLEGVDLDIDDGEFVVVIGASGAGKSSLLRAVAGLDPVICGSLYFGDRDVTHLEPGERDVSMVFQQPVLLPHLDVRRNVAFPLEVRHTSAGDIRTRVDAEVRAMHIEPLLDRATEQLSSGEAQLVQIARAMVRVPAVLLLDEPLEPLDAALREHMRHELRLLQHGYGVTTIWTTNDALETMSLPDRVVVLASGAIAQVGTPLEVYAHPVDLSTARLTGELSVVEVTVEADGSGGFWLVHPAFRYRAWSPVLAASTGNRVVLAVRPEGAEISDTGTVIATVERLQHLGSNSTAQCRLADDHITISTTRRDLRVGDHVPMRLDDVLLFDPVTGRRLV